MIVKIESYFKHHFDIKKQTPNSAMQWGGFTFTDEDVEECDYLVILDYPKTDFSVKVNRNNIIHICLEPPNEISKYRQYANKNVSLIYNQLDIKRNNVLSHGALPWHVNKSYDFLSNVKVADLSKENKIVWVTSNQRSSKGHNVRMDFLDAIKTLPFVELYGRGIKPIDDKWDVISTSKYAIAYENFQNDYYWTEKIMDCYLSFAMPLYYGCNSIEKFFPKDSFIQIDPKDKHSDLLLKEIVASNQWEENLDAIVKARDLILNEYQLFPFLHHEIKALEAKKEVNVATRKEVFHFKGGNDYFDNYPISVDIEKWMMKIKKKIKL
ncbi:glycosyltransferase family 10 domain-containing protein [Flavobacterium sp. N1994]|uniref:glycosyltransferase family 10 domain-containing protein n=1 Tax=Flavobacterium sp. N1994 TaxID=2986827 RepID=UPI0022229D9A|nr:glycosyltransferase family 10 [Flavobacterium sp. N1994]